MAAKVLGKLKYTSFKFCTGYCMHRVLHILTPTAQADALSSHHCGTLHR